jgi:heme exporter protein D
MRNLLDFSSWSTMLSTLLGLVLVSVVAVGIRLIFMQTLQRRRERENRQINERLRTLIAAYKVLGGSFTGELTVDPAHLRELRARQGEGTIEAEPINGANPSERRRRIRDAVEGALSDIILLGTEEQVRLAVRAAGEMVAGRAVETAALVVSLRDFIRQALDLAPIPPEWQVPAQGPTRVSGGGRAKEGAEAKRGGGAGGAGGGGMGGGLGASHGQDDDENSAPHHR